MKTILAAIGVLSLGLFLLYQMSDLSEHRCRSAYDVKVRADLRAIGSQIKLFEKDNKKFPESLYELVGEYLLKVPRDPWGKEYKYELKADNVVIYTYDQEKSKEKYSVRIEYNI